MPLGICRVPLGTNSYEQFVSEQTRLAWRLVAMRLFALCTTTVAVIEQEEPIEKPIEGITAQFRVATIMNTTLYC